MQGYITTAINHPDFFTTIIVLWFVFMFFVPVFWYLLKGQTKQNNAIIKEMKNWFSNIALSQVKTKLTDTMIVDVAKQKVWYASETKLAFIRETLTTNDIINRKERVKAHIVSTLEHESSKYIIYLNQFVICINWTMVKVWDYIEQNFPMDSFFEELFSVIFRDNEKEIKINDCRFIMKTYQNTLFEKMRKDLWKD